MATDGSDTEQTPAAGSKAVIAKADRVQQRSTVLEKEEEEKGAAPAKASAKVAAAAASAVLVEYPDSDGEHEARRSSGMCFVLLASLGAASNCWRLLRVCYSLGYALLRTSCREAGKEPLALQHFKSFLPLSWTYFPP